LKALFWQATRCGDAEAAHRIGRQGQERFGMKRGHFDQIEGDEELDFFK
jgi:hypothetical protein